MADHEPEKPALTAEETTSLKEMAKSYAVPRTFYFTLEHNDSWAQTGGDKESYHVEVSVWRLRPDGSDVDKNSEGREVGPRVLRTWIDKENTSFRVVYAKRPLGTTLDFTGKLELFPCDGDGLGIIESKDSPKLPALVMVNLDLEPDREYMAFARVHDGIQFGPWTRIAQSRLDFVRLEREDSPSIRSVGFAESYPTITATATCRKGGSPRDAKGSSPTPVSAGTSGSNGYTIRVEGTVSDQVSVGKVFVNGAAVSVVGNPDNPTTFTFAAQDIKVTEGCTRVEIIAENQYGNRSQAVKVFTPVYDAQGKVTGYEAEDAELKSESHDGNADSFRIRFYAIPYRLFAPPCPSFGSGTIECHLLAGKDEFVPVDLYPSQKLAQEPYFGVPASCNVWPKVLEANKNPEPPSSRVIVSISVKEGASGLPEPIPERKDIRTNRYVWVSGPLSLRHNDALTTQKSEVRAAPGDLLEAHVLVEKTPTNYNVSEGMLPLPIFVPFDDDQIRFGTVLTPKAAATDVYAVALDGTKLPALKNGDLIRVRAYNISTEPVPRWTPPIYKFTEDHIPYGDMIDESSAANQSRATNMEPVEELGRPWMVISKGDYSDNYDKWFDAPPGFQYFESYLKMENRDDECIPDRAHRDEPGVTTLEEHLPLQVWTVKRPAPKTSDSCLVKRQNPGKVSRGLAYTMPRQLVTQLYGPQLEGMGYQILPNGYLRLEVHQEDDVNVVEQTMDPSPYWNSPNGAAAPQPKTGCAHSYRVLEIIKRWRLGKGPSASPALAGTNPRVGGPGTHRVGGLHHKQDDGSVYVHNGEFFQAAEDLYAKGKSLDLLFRRVHLSHSLFTTDVGRNWDWMGNMRVVEMLNGDVCLMNGAAQMEYYTNAAVAKGVAASQTIGQGEPSSKPPATEQKPKDESETLSEPEVTGTPEAAVNAFGPVTVTHLTLGTFDYSKLWAQSQYTSPKGAYRCLVKGHPVEMPGMPATEAQSDAARFYLVDKHGTVWTFREDVRFRSRYTRPGMASGPDEPPAGVRNQYLLVAVHHRNQRNYIKLQRDVKGLVRGIIDDMGRVTRLDRLGAKKKSFDMFLTTVRDFASRQLCFDRASAGSSGKPGASSSGSGATLSGATVLVSPLAKQEEKDDTAGRNLEDVAGPERRDIGGEKKKPIVSYAYVNDPQNGPRHRLKSVTDPRENAGQKRAYIEIVKWENGCVTTQKVSSHLDADTIVRKLEGTYEFVHELIDGGVINDSQLKARTWTVTREGELQTKVVFGVRTRPDRPFSEIDKRIDEVKKPGSSDTFTGNAETHFRYDANGELILTVRPSEGASISLYSVDGSTAGNPSKTETLDAGAGFGHRVLGLFDNATSAGVEKAGRSDSMLDAAATGLGDTGLASRTSYPEYDTRFNLPKTVAVDAYRDQRAAHTAKTAMEYDAEGNVTKVSGPQLNDAAREWPSSLASAIRNVVDHAGADTVFQYDPTTGMLQYVQDQRDCRTWYYYYAADPERHLPGDACDRVGMVALTNQNQAVCSREGQPLIFARFSGIVGEVDSSAMRSPGEKRETDCVTNICPDLLGNPEIVVDPNGFWHLSKFNEVSLLLKDRGILKTAVVSDELADKSPCWTETIPAWQEAPDRGGVAHAYNLNDERVTSTVPAVDGKYGGSAAQIVKVLDYDSLGNVVGTRVGGDLVSEARHDFRGNPVATIDEAGTHVTLTYDERGLCIREEFAGSGAAGSNQYGYDMDGNRIFHRDPCQWCEGWSYDRVGRVTYSVSKTGLITAFGYGPGGALWSETQYETEMNSPLSGGISTESPSVSQELDMLKSWLEGFSGNCGNLTPGTTQIQPSRIYADAQYWRDERGNVWKTSRLFESDLPRGAVSAGAKRADFITRWTHDDLPLAEANDRGVTRSCAYDNQGRLTGEYDNTYLKESSFDRNGNVLTTHSPAETVSYSYDAFGNVTRTENSSLSIVLAECEYDFSGQVLYRRLMPQSDGVYQTEANHYDAAGRLGVKTTVYSTLPVAGYAGVTPITQTITWKYDECGRLECVTTAPDSAGGTTTLTYVPSLFGPRSTTLNSLGLETSVEYCPRGDKRKWTDANGTTFEAAHDGEGRVVLLTATGADGIRMHQRHFTRDLAGRIVRALDKQERYFDAPGTVVPSSGVGLLTISSDYTYDTLGSQVSETQHVEGEKGLSNPPARTLCFSHSSTGASNGAVLPAAVDRRGQVLEAMNLNHELDALDRPIGTKWSEAGEPETGMSGVGYLSSVMYGMETDRKRQELVLSLASSRRRSPDDVSPLSLKAAANASLACGGISDTSEEATLGRMVQGSGDEKSNWTMSDENGVITTRTCNLRWGSKSDPQRATDSVKRQGVLTRNGTHWASADMNHNAVLPDGQGGRRWEDEKSQGQSPASSHSGECVTARTLLPSGSVKETKSSTTVKPLERSKPRKKEETRSVESIGGAFRLPSGEKACLKAFGVSKDRSAVLARYEDGAVADYSVKDAPVEAGEHLTFCRNAFGHVVEIKGPSSGPAPSDAARATCVFRHDAFGRPVLKEVPRAVAVAGTYGPDSVEQSVSDAVSAYQSILGLIILLSNPTDLPDVDYVVKIPRQSPCMFFSMIRAYLPQLQRARYGGTSKNPPCAHRRIIFQGVGTRFPRSVEHLPVPTDWDLYGFSDITFKDLDFEGSVSLRQCTGIVFDNCSFTRIAVRAAITVIGRFSQLQVQNCVFRSARKGIEFIPEEDLAGSSALIAHNRFEASSDQDEYVAITGTLARNTREDDHNPFTSIGVVNNLFILPNSTVQNGVTRHRALADALLRRTQRGFNAYFGGWTRTAYVDVDSAGGWIGNDLYLRYDARLLPDVRSGRLMAGLGCAGVTGKTSGHAPVLWDAANRLRDAKHPTIGPVEWDVPGTGKTTLHRYLHEGESVSVRETYRYADASGARDYARADVTRMVSAVPGGAGVRLYVDDDGTVDAEVSDRDGQPWFWHRVRSGWQMVPASAGLPAGVAPKKMSVKTDLHGTGMLNPLNLPSWSLADQAPWYAHVLEPDVLMGRRGVAGWSGSRQDEGLWLGDYVGPTERLAGRLDWSSGKTWLYLGAGLLVGLFMLATGVWIFVALGGIVAATVGLGMAGLMFAARASAGQTFGQVVGGGVADVTGVSGIYGGLTNKDIATGEYLGLSSEERAFGIGMGSAQLGAFAVGPKIGKWASHKFAGQRVNWSRILAPSRAAADAAYAASHVQGLVAGQAGKFAALEALAVVGDELTPHHMPQAALRFTSRAQGGALVVTGEEHAMTRTYLARGAVTARQEAGMSFRSVLARDIHDVRGIVGRRYNQGLRDLLNYYRQNFPELMEGR